MEKDSSFVEGDDRANKLTKYETYLSGLSLQLAQEVEKKIIQYGTYIPAISPKRGEPFSLYQDLTILHSLLKRRDDILRNKKLINELSNELADKLKRSSDYIQERIKKKFTSVTELDWLEAIKNNTSLKFQGKKFIRNSILPQPGFRKILHTSPESLPLHIPSQSLTEHKSRTELNFGGGENRKMEQERPTEQKPVSLFERMQKLYGEEMRENQIFLQRAEKNQGNLGHRQQLQPTSSKQEQISGLGKNLEKLLPEREQGWVDLTEMEEALFEPASFQSSNIQTKSIPRVTALESDFIKPGFPTKDHQRKLLIMLRESYDVAEKCLAFFHTTTKELHFITLDQLLLTAKHKSQSKWPEEEEKIFQQILQNPSKEDHIQDMYLLCKYLGANQVKSKILEVTNGAPDKEAALLNLFSNSFRLKDLVDPQDK